MGQVAKGMQMLSLMCGDKEATLTPAQLCACLCNSRDLPANRYYDYAMEILENVSHSVEKEMAQQKAISAEQVVNMLVRSVETANKEMGFVFSDHVAHRMPTLIAHIFPPCFAIACIKLWGERIHE